MAVKQILIAIDQLANALLGGMADETLSARSWRIRHKNPRARAVIDGLFFWQPNHCESAFLSEVNRLQLPKEYREE